ncbi:uncharacterized protein K02A2.6-like [Macrosteles quadrilineatus]|uniref:uncharacterized protein K02A2.6-like n=1 Tax=Macrosteles quadrilineatus TaxID=74068 RepID=UPI0023E1F5D0|nr:uncharacterized protein K02A2.6-like [Macrosteles quadrilineatus]
MALHGHEEYDNDNTSSTLTVEQPTTHSLTHFKFEKFDATKETWKYYYQRFELELIVCGLQHNQEAKRILLLKWIGAEHYRIVVDNFYPTPILTVDYEEIVEFISNFYKPKTSYLAERLKFGKIVKNKDQSIRIFVNNLRAGATECEFKDTLDERLRDQFLLGLNDPKLQEVLIRKHPEEKARLVDIVKDAYLMEMAHSQQQQIETLGKFSCDTQVNKVGATRTTKPLYKRDSTRISLNPESQCLRCGLAKHKTGEHCKAMNIQCRACGKMGHFERVCLKSKNVVIEKNLSRRYVKQIDKFAGMSDYSYNVDFSRHNNDGCPDISDELEAGSVKNISQINNVEKFCYVVNLTINRVPITMEYDTAAARTIISKSTWEQIGEPALTPTEELGAYPSFRIPMLGETKVAVSLGSTTLQLSVAVTDSVSGTPLLGKDWIAAFNLDPNCEHVCKQNSYSVYHINTDIIDKEGEKRKIYREFKDIITNNLGTVKNFKAKVRVANDVQLPIHKPRPVPFALHSATSKELDRLVSSGVLEPVDPATTPILCASPLVVVPKSNGEVRLCADFKVSINPHLIDDEYCIPTFEETVLKLNGSKFFSVIDLKDAYLQIPVDEESKKYLVVATHKGYFTFNRLPFGIKTAPKIFQKLMDQLLVGTDDCAWYFDDICVGGRSGPEHIDRLKTVLNILRRAGLCTREDKLQLFKQSVTYLGHKISALGIQPVEDRVEAIKKQPPPKNVSELRSFLGSVNYYSRFIPNLQSLCFPLHRLLHKNSTWVWNSDCEDAFNNIKSNISNNMVLVHYDPKLPLILATDACNIGLGAVLLHRGSDGSQKPIAAASRTLNSAEQNYSSIDKEALAIIFGVEKFYKYLYGRHFTLLCDHKPLERIFGAKQPIPKHAASRLARWAIILSGYDYDINYRAGKDNVLADCLSRLPLEGGTNIDTYQTLGEVNQVRSMRIEDLPLTKQTLQDNTHRDDELKHIISYCVRGWPDRSSIPDNLKIFYDKRHELSYEEGILLWQERIVIPKSLRGDILSYLHVSHPGIVAMRSLAKLYVYWPKIDDDIENLVKTCTRCQTFRKNDVETPLNSWNIPENAWERLHIDFKGPFDGYMWLVVIDAYSRWLEIFPMKNATSNTVIRRLRELFCRYGLVKQIVTDNGNQFVSEEFREFCRKNNVIHIRTTPYHSRSNGCVERVIQTFQNKYLMTDINDHEQRLHTLLFSYRTTPHSSTGRTPAELFLKRNPRTLIDTLRPDVKEKMKQSSERQKFYHDIHSKRKDFSAGDTVWVKRNPNENWREGVVLRKTAPLSYRVNIDDKEYRQHADHLRTRQQIQPAQQSIQQQTSQKLTSPSSGTTNQRKSSRNIRRPMYYHDEY